MAEIHEIIDGLLADRGITGYRMCADLGFSRSFMTELRKGRAKSLKTETAQKIADYFGVTVDYLLTGDQSVLSDTSPGTIKNAPGQEAEGEKQELLNVISSLSQEEAKKLLEHAQLLLKARAAQE